MRVSAARRTYQPLAYFLTHPTDGAIKMIEGSFIA